MRTLSKWIRRSGVSRAARWAAAAALLLPVAAGAVSYGTFTGTNFEYQNVEDDFGLFGPDPADITLVGDTLTFFPDSFEASAAGDGAGGNDQVEDLLSATIVPVGGATIGVITISEFGDLGFSGSGTVNTNVTATASGFVTVLESASGLTFPVVIPFNMVLAAEDITSGTGTSLWSGTVTVDIKSLVADATRVQLSFDNILTANSEIDSSSFIRKKVGLTTAVPEPATGLLLALGLAAFTRFRRR